MANIVNSWTASSGARVNSLQITVGSITENNMLVAVVFQDGNDGFTNSDGFTLISGIGSGTATYCSVWAKIATASEPASYTWNINATDEMGIILLEMEGTAVDATIANNFVTSTWAATSASVIPEELAASSGATTGDLAFYAFSTDGQHTISTISTVGEPHTQYSGNPVYADNDATGFVVLLDAALDTSLEGIYDYDPPTSTIDASDDYAAVTVVVKRGPAVAYTTEPLTLTPNTFGVYTGIVPSTETYRWRLDDGGETDATWKELADTEATLPLNDNHRLRVGIEQIVPTSGNITANLEYRKNNEVTSTWTNQTHAPTNVNNGRWGAKVNVTKDGEYMVSGYAAYSSNRGRVGRLPRWGAPNTHFSTAQGIYVVGPDTVANYGEDGCQCTDDGDFLVVMDEGSAQVHSFWRNGSSWSKYTQNLSPGYGIGTLDISISGDGSILAICRHDEVRIYHWNDTGSTSTSAWVQDQSISLSSNQSTGLELNYDGTMLIFGGLAAITGYGNVHTYTKSAGTFSRYVTTTVDLTPFGDPLGSDVCRGLSFIEDEWLVIGMSNYNSGNGGFLIYTWNSTTTSWDLASDVVTRTGGDNLGLDVSIYKADGEVRVAAGLPAYDSTQTNQGKIDHFTITEGWKSVGAQGTSVEAIVYADSLEVTNGQATTQQITTGGFDAGKVAEASGTSLSFTSNNSTEIEYVIKALSANSVNGDFFDFRLTGVVANNVTPRWTLGGVSLRVIEFTNPTATLNGIAFNRTVPALVNWQGFYHDGDVTAMTPRAFPAQTWTQGDDEDFVVLNLIHFSGIEPLSLNLGWVYSINLGQTWVDMTTAEDMGVEIEVADFWSNGASYTNILTGPDCSGTMTGEKMSNDSFDSVTPTGDNYCKEYAVVFRVNSAYLDPDATQVWIGIRETNYGDAIITAPIKFLRTSIIPFNTASLGALDFTTPGIANLPVYIDRTDFLLESQPFETNLLHEVIQWDADNYYGSEITTLELPSNHNYSLGPGFGLNYLIYTEGLTDGVTAPAFVLQYRLNGGTWTDLPYGSTYTGVNGPLLYNGSVNDHGWFDQYHHPDGAIYKQWEQDDGVNLSYPNVAYVRATSINKGFVKPNAGASLSAGFITFKHVTFGTATVDGSFYEFRLKDDALVTEVPGSAPYFSVTIDNSLGTYDHTLRDPRMACPLYRPIKFEAFNFLEYRPETALTHFRGKEDYAGETDTSWLAALDTSWSQTGDRGFRLRLGFETATYEDPQSQPQQFFLQHRIQGADVDNWVEGPKLLDLFPTTTNQCYDIAMTKDEVTRLAAGIPYEVESGETGLPGAVAFFTKTGGTWVEDTQTWIYHPDPSANANFGSTVHLNDDGDVVVIGARRDSNYNNDGEVYTYDLVGSTWVYRNVIRSPYVGLEFGSGVRISGDGTRLVVSGYGGFNSTEPKTVYTYKDVNGQWVEEVPKLEHPATYHWAVPGIDLNGPGTKLVVYAEDSDLGELFIYHFTEDGWVLDEMLTHSEGFNSKLSFNYTGDVIITENHLSQKILIWDLVDKHYQFRTWFYDSTRGDDYILSSYQGDKFYFGQANNGDMYSFENSYKGRWYNVGAAGTTNTPVSLFDSPYLTDGQATTQQITTSPNFNTGEVTEDDTIGGFLAVSSVNGTESEVVWPLIINSTGDNPGTLGDEVEFRVLNVDDNRFPESKIPVTITVGQPAILFGTASLALEYQYFPIEVEFYPPALTLADGTPGRAVEAGYAQYELFDEGPLILSGGVYEVSDTTVFNTSSLATGIERFTTIPTTAIINQKDYRLLADDNYEASATVQGKLSSPWGQTYDELFRLRYVLENTVLSAPNQSHTYKAQYNLNNAGTINPVGSPIERSVADAVEEALGRDVTISGDGKVLAAGAPEYLGTYDNQGRVYIYDRELDGSWTYRQYVEAPTPAADMYFGQGLALSFSGNQLFVGEPHYTISSYIEEGRVHVFIEDGGTFTHSETIISGSTLNNYAHFGWSLDTNEAGDRLFIGIPNYTSTLETPDLVECGAFEVQKKVSGVWQWDQAKYLNLAGGHFGTSIASSNDGTHLSIGVPDYNSPGIIVFWDLINGVWNIRPSAIGGANAGEQFGSAVASNATGRTILVGAPKFTGQDLEQGVAYVVDWDGDLVSPQYTNRQTLLNPDIDPGDNYGSGVGTSRSFDEIVIGAPYNTNIYSKQGAVYTLEPSYTWTDISSSTPVQFDDSTWITDGEVTTQRLSSGHFDSGTVEEAGAASVTWTTEGFSEVEYILTVDSAQTIATDLFKVRVVESTNSTVPQIRENTAQFEVFSGDVDQGDVEFITSTTMTALGEIFVDNDPTMDLVTSSTMTADVAVNGTLDLVTSTTMTGLAHAEYAGQLRLRTNVEMYADLVYKPIKYGGTAWNATTVMTGTPRAVFGGQAALASSSTLAAEGSVFKYGILGLNTSSTVVATGSYQHTALLDLQTNTTVTLNGSLVRPISASFYTNSTLTMTGGLTKHAKCDIIGETSISLIAHNYIYVNTSYVTSTTTDMSGNILRGGTLDLYPTSSLSATANIDRSTTLALSSHTYWNAQGYIIPACVQVHTDIIAIPDETIIAATANTSTTICGE